MQRRLSYLDVLRIVGSVFVVFMHTAAGALRTDVAGHTGWFFLAALSSLAFSAVPLFFMITGYVLTASERTKDVRVLFRERLPRLIVPLLFWSVLYILQRLAAAHELSARAFGAMALSALRQPVNVSLWFMYALVAMYLVSPLLCGGLRSLERRGELLLLGIIALVKAVSALAVVFPAFGAKYLDFAVLNYLDAFGGHLACFVLGWFLGKTKKRVPAPAIRAAAIVLWAVVAAGTILRSKAAGEYVASFQSQTGLFETALAGCIFLLVKQAGRLDRPAVGKITREIAPCTFPIYLMHNLLLLLSGAFAPVSLSGVVLKTVVIYAAALIIAWVCRFVPVLSYLACGLPRRRKRGSGSAG
ncbi:MAG: acyltransferase [Oscillospiraceae bacterium]|nr:acyltransferase [Oscillospiraceae bacterium]